ncbi:MAG: hypothetical protein E7475_08075 [Ruminococcaceae bacterium]|nr:hypothetical protein [Oscillospiraceae bacterium]
MNKIRKIWEPYMLRPTLYSVFTKFVSTLCIVLLWDRFVNSRNVTPYGVVDFAFFIVGLYFIVWTWLQYLILDGMKYDVFEKMAEMMRRKPKHFKRDMVDFVDEKVTTFDMLEDDEQTVAKIVSNFITALCFLIPSIIAVIL